MKKILALMALLSLCATMIACQTLLPVPQDGSGQEGSSETEDTQNDPNDGAEEQDPTGGQETAFSRGLSYSVLDDGSSCAITGIGSCSDTVVRIPEEIDGYTVREIRGHAFYEGGILYGDQASRHRPTHRQLCISGLPQPTICHPRQRGGVYRRVRLYRLQGLAGDRLLRQPEDHRQVRVLRMRGADAGGDPRKRGGDRHLCFCVL